ncbi:hypothetical protein GCM10028791_35900 [Echinicola sediminis]
MVTKNIQIYCLFLITLGLFCSCEEEEKEQHLEMDYEEYVFGVRLADDPGISQKYLEYHQNIWPEVEAGFQKAGYQQIRLYMFGNSITMTIRVPKGADLDSMGQLSRGSHPKVEEWQELMDSFQKGLPGVEEGQKWVKLEKIYEFNQVK